MKKPRLAPLLLAAMLLAGCALMPKEEEFPNSLVIRSYEAESFKFAYVERGDVINSTRISATYMPAKTETYRFTVNGELLDEIYVRLGDMVEEGQLLAQLDVSAYEIGIENAKSAISRLELQIAHLEEWREVALARAERDAAPGQAAESRKAVAESYDQRLQPLTDQLYIQRLQLAEYEKQLARRQIRAAFSGAVTYVRRAPDGYRSSKYDSIITVADSTTSIFRLQTEYWEYFQPGRACSVTVKNVSYDATAVDETELGLSPVQRESGKKADVYLALDEVTFDLEDGDKGTIILALDERHDVLKLPVAAVGKLNGEPVVYYQDEEGVKRYRPVTLGLTGDGEVEILDGVSEGDAVIIS